MVSPEMNDRFGRSRGGWGRREKEEIRLRRRGDDGKVVQQRSGQRWNEDDAKSNVKNGWLMTDGTSKMQINIDGLGDIRRLESRGGGWRGWPGTIWKC